MNLEHLTVSARERNSWSAIDLGCALARQHWKPLFMSWFIPALCLFVALNLVFYRWPEFTILMVWWMKPLLDRMPLYILSKELFGERVSVREALRHWRSIWRLDWLPWLLWRRFNPMRSFVMPVTLLEGTTGDVRERRLGVLQYDTAGAAMWLTVIAVHIETLLVGGALALFAWLLPVEINFDIMSWLYADNGSFVHVSNVLTLLAFSLVAPFYVAAGFMLYINRRIQLEAWDLEITFRNFAGRNAKATPPVTVSALLCSLLLFSGLPGHSRADTVDLDATAPVQDAEYFHAEIEAVFEEDAFHNVVKYYTLVWKYENEAPLEGEIPDWLIRLVEVCERILPAWDWVGDTDPRELLASLLRLAIIAPLVILVLYILSRYRRTVAKWLRAPKEEEEAVEAPDTLFGLDVSRASLLENPPEQVMDLWHAGDHRGAVALLYRSTLAMLIHRMQMPFAASHTETECAEIVAHRGDSSISGYFGSLTDGWQRLAYGHVDPDPLWLKALCHQWYEVFPDG